MSTSNSPIEKLRTEARRMAVVMKDRNHPKVQQARKKDKFKTGIVMDDKIITLELSWIYIDGISEDDLVDYIVRLMKGEKPNG